MEMATLASYFGLGQQKHRSLVDVRKNMEVLKHCATVLFLWFEVLDGLLGKHWRNVGLAFNCISLLFGSVIQLSLCKDLDDFVEAAFMFYGKQNMLDNTPITLSLEKNNDPRLLKSPLKFPGKLAIDALNNRLFISDSNHNRLGSALPHPLVVTDLDGIFIVQIGSSGDEGLQDGSFDDATFNRPQGLAYNAKKNMLYVADTENHAL
ncbi:hypothetical protein RJT34_12229 [Clitoria ternatea]|uniref:NHL repeat-containing protein 2 n=1 Tax=Clitoria ternatea TaxID=43366 RepID=A0AAN9JNJ1_CLITE